MLDVGVGGVGEMMCVCGGGGGRVVLLDAFASSEVNGEE